MTPFIVTLTGPSCAGKTTLERRLKKEGFVQVISHTTRKPRAGEEDGKAYYFLSEEEFVEKKAAGLFVESVYFNGSYYGVSAEEVRRVAEQGKPIVVIVEPEGLMQIRDYCRRNGWEVFSVFVDNPAEVIARRFLRRFLDDYAKAGGISLDLDATHEVIGTYARRLGVMLRDECHWAEDHGPGCDLWLLDFNERNIDKTADFLCETARQTLAA